MYFLLITTALIFTFIASYIDIKTREVPDYLNFSLISIALGTRLIYSLITLQWNYFLYAIAFAAIAFLIGLAMYKLRMWGGGDLKLITALAALLATFPQKEYFLAKFLIILLLTAALYGIIYTIVIAIKQRIIFLKDLKKRLQKYKKIRITILVILLGTTILLFLNIPENTKLFLIVSSLLITFYFYIYLIIKSVENISMIKEIPVSRLREEDWLAEDIKLSKETIKKTITGLTKEHIQKIKHSRIKTVKIKEGIPFVPPFFISTLIIFIYSIS